MIWRQLDDRLASDKAAGLIDNKTINGEHLFPFNARP